jgi:hypothetical protein
MMSAPAAVLGELRKFDDEEHRAARSVRAVRPVRTPNTPNTPNAGGGIFKGDSMGEWLRQAALREKPKQLAGPFWSQGELTLLFGTTGEGKTAFAIQTTDDIARGYSTTGLKVESESSGVLYFDFELSAAQHHLRYSNDNDRDDIFEFSNNFIRVEMDISDYSRGMELVNNWEQELLSQIEGYIIESQAKVVVIDNITWLSRETDKGKFALPLMQRLVNLKKVHGLSIFVMAHTPKRDETRPLCLNDLAGSRILANFADSIFAIGKSASDPSVRYLKQIKSRSSEIRYSTENVATFTFEKRGNFLGFQFTHEISEREHLRPLGDGETAHRVRQAKELAAKGASQREIAQELGVSLSTANKYVNAPEHPNAVNAPNSTNARERPRTPANIEMELPDEIYIPPNATDEEIDAICAGR